MKMLKKFLSETIDIPIWAILLFDFVVLLNIILNVVLIIKR